MYTYTRIRTRLHNLHKKFNVSKEIKSCFTYHIFSERYSPNIGDDLKKLNVGRFDLRAANGYFGASLSKVWVRSNTFRPVTIALKHTHTNSCNIKSIFQIDQAGIADFVDVSALLNRYVVWENYQCLTVTSLGYDCLVYTALIWAKCIVRMFAFLPDKLSISPNHKKHIHH